MALNDIMSDVKQDPANFTGDEAIENRVLSSILKLLEDKISEVKNQAVKWLLYFVLFQQANNLTHNISLGVLSKVVRENQMELIMDKLIELFGNKDDETRDIAGLGKYIVITA
jgi:cullin-associated NEDD8-dissociated protein 1